jgi:hypothetical protein
MLAWSTVSRVSTPKAKPALLIRISTFLKSIGKDDTTALT